MVGSVDVTNSKLATKSSLTADHAFNLQPPLPYKWVPSSPFKSAWLAATVRAIGGVHIVKRLCLAPISASMHVVCPVVLLVHSPMSPSFLELPPKAGVLLFPHLHPQRQRQRQPQAMASLQMCALCFLLEVCSCSSFVVDRSRKRKLDDRTIELYLG